MHKKSVFTRRLRKKYSLGEFALLGFEMTLQLDYAKGAPAGYSALFDWFFDNYESEMLVSPDFYEGQPAEVRVRAYRDEVWHVYPSITSEIKEQFLEKLRAVPFLTIKDVSPVFDCAYTILQDGKLQLEKLDPVKDKAYLKDQRRYLKFMQERGLDPLTFVAP